MSTEDIYVLADIAAAAQAQIQHRYPSIDPVVGVNRSMRKAGFAVDMMTIDCLKTRKRITLLLNDDNPGFAAYQFTYIDQPPAAEFTDVAFSTLNAEQLCSWISSYFLADTAD